jgi:hypothetical protein
MASEHERWQQGDSDAQCKLMRQNKCKGAW